MTTKLEAINDMLSCIGQSPLNTLEGTKSYFTMAAENILEAENKRVQLRGWQFNSEDKYQLTPNENNIIDVPDNVLMMNFPVHYKNRFVIREKKIYDKFRHTYTIDKPLYCSIVWGLKYDDLPEIAQTYIKMSAAYKFVKRELGSQSVTQYTQEDVMEAWVDLLNFELESGDYTMIPEYDVRKVKQDIWG
jgi:hypothetical protein